MNLRLFSMVLLTSALPLSAQARASEISLSRGDFISAKRTNQFGEEIVSVKLSKSGKAKLKKVLEPEELKRLELSLES